MKLKRTKIVLLTALGVAALSVAPAALAEKPSVNPGAVDEHPDQGNHGQGVNQGVNPGAVDEHPDQGNHGQGNNGKGKNPNVSYVFKGTYNADGTVAVTKGNKHVRNADLVGQSVAFDFSQAKVTVADTNADGATDLTDVAADDKVVVKAKLPKSDPGAAPYAAKHLIDQTNAPEEPADEPAPVV